MDIQGQFMTLGCFENFPIFLDAETDPTQLFPGNSHLIGDAAYPLKSWILRPFKNNGPLTTETLQFCVHLHNDGG